MFPVVLPLLALFVQLASATDTIGFGTGFGVNLADPNNPVISSGLDIGLGKKGTFGLHPSLTAGTKGFQTGLNAGVTQNDDPVAPETKAADVPVVKKMLDAQETTTLWTSTVLASSPIPAKIIGRSEVIMELPATTQKPWSTPLFDVLKKGAVITTTRPPLPIQHDAVIEPISSTIVMPMMTSSWPEGDHSDESHSHEDGFFSSTVLNPKKE